MSKPVSVYEASIVKELKAHYGYLLVAYDDFPIVIDHLAAIAERMWEGLQEAVPPIFNQINNYYKPYLGKSRDEILRGNLTKKDCYEAIAHGCCFSSWDGVKKEDALTYDLLFEEAVDTFLKGDLVRLQAIVEERPDLFKQRSVYGHRATLLHYAGSNGVEMWRQVVPDNLPQMTRFLLENGADLHAKMEVYGGNFDTLALLETSAHPYAAGLIEPMKEILEAKM